MKYRSARPQDQPGPEVRRNLLPRKDLDSATVWLKPALLHPSTASKRTSGRIARQQYRLDDTSNNRSPSLNQPDALAELGQIAVTKQDYEGLGTWSRGCSTRRTMELTLGCCVICPRRSRQDEQSKRFDGIKRKKTNRIAVDALLGSGIPGEATQNRADLVISSDDISQHRPRLVCVLLSVDCYQRSAPCGTVNSEIAMDVDHLLCVCYGMITANAESIKGNVKRKTSPFGWMPVHCYLGIQPPLFARALHSESGLPQAECVRFVSACAAEIRFLSPVVPFRCGDGAHRF